MSLDPTALSPSAGVSSSPFSGSLASPISRPRPQNCLAGTKPTIPTWSPTSIYLWNKSARSYKSIGASSGAICFLGDSLTHYMDVSPISPFAVNLGIGGDTTAGLLNRLEDIQPFLGVAGATVLMLGVNDSIGFPANSQTIGRLTDILNWITGPMVFCKIVHVNVDIYMPSSPNKALLNPNIDTINSAMDAVIASRISAGHPTATVDINSQVSAGDGQLLTSMQMGDGIHWAAEAKRIWRTAVTGALRGLAVS